MGLFLCYNKNVKRKKLFILIIILFIIGIVVAGFFIYQWRINISTQKLVDQLWQEMFSNNLYPDKMQLEVLQSPVTRMAQLNILNTVSIDQGIARYYYLWAAYYLDGLDNQNSTDNLVKGIEYDPYPGSQDYLTFTKLRRELFEQEPEKKELFLNE